MATLTFTYKHRTINCPLKVRDKGMTGIDYIITGKNGYSLFYFRKKNEQWVLDYGTMPNDMHDAIIHALSLRFDNQYLNTAL